MAVLCGVASRVECWVGMEAQSVQVQEGEVMRLEPSEYSVKVAIVPKAEVTLLYDPYDDKLCIWAPWGLRLDVLRETPDSITFRVREITATERALGQEQARRQHEAYLNAGGE